jgi:spermidine/putrescine-binding protein
MNLPKLAGLAVAALALAAAGCRREEAAPAAAPVAARPAGPGRLNIYIWSEYLPQEVIDEFSQSTGIQVNVDLYDSNEALLAKLQSGVADYDLVVPSDYMVKTLIAERLLQPLDRTRLARLGNLDPRFLDKPFDPGNRYSVPYFWGTTGIGYDKTKVKEPVTSWSVLFDPKWKGQILMLDDVREVFGVALKSMGQSLNTTDPAILARAAEKLKRQKRLVKTYDSGDFANILAAGDVALAHGYNGQIAEVVAHEPDRLAYVVPAEGGTFWMDNLAIPAGARNVDSAHRFIDYVLLPEVNAEIVNGVSYASANLPARQFIDPEILNDPSVYPGDDVLSRCEFLADVGETTTLLDRYWTEIKAE